MTTYLSPPGPAEPAAPSIGERPTAVAAFVGRAADGPLHRPVPVDGWSGFGRTFGEFAAGSYLAHAVFGYFLNGGTRAYVVRTDDDTAAAGLAALADVDEVTMVVAPDVLAAYEHGLLDAATVEAARAGLIAHCAARGDRMALLDAMPGRSPQQVRDWRRDAGAYDSAYAALYYPWIKVFDPVAGTNRYVPPSGHLAGVWARSDATRGVHRAPTNEVIRGAVAPETPLTRQQQELLAPVGVNCLRAFPGRGIRVWGARTLADDPAWRYVNVRRLFTHLERSIVAGLAPLAGHPADPALCARARLLIEEFLTAQWRRGALVGLTLAEAFTVACAPDPAVPGRLACRVAVAPVRPAEFVPLRLAPGADGPPAYGPPGAARYPLGVLPRAAEAAAVGVADPGPVG
ncbi:hypothetical protein GCM10010123_07880 [Pilimelia anulata]|uniref:Phage tail sheath family protein n=1 Tax=Pilimelia anulata TaxID=53371 RepID=A0A8J3F7P3_9ACTN|nr:phage tail sheath subtilisin-like domain-containing protein [Pilimelia anulata]GGJ80354.1 hypothetical protein GCM10010123_07880 [Pilimelia anulata]